MSKTDDIDAIPTTDSVSDRWIRDYFAAQTIQAIVTGILTNGWGYKHEEMEDYAALAYSQADAMLVERAKGMSNE